MTTNNNIIDFSARRIMQKCIKPVHVNREICAVVAETVPHVVGEGRAAFVERLVRAYLEGVR